MTFLLSFITIVAFLISFPGSIYLIILSLAACWRCLFYKPSAHTAQSPQNLAVVVPAHNESANVLVALNSIEQAHKTQGRVDVYVIADNCSDDTADIARTKNVTVLERFNEKERGKGYALDFAFQYLEDKDYDGYVVIDADCILEPNLFTEFEAAFSRGVQAMQASYLVSSDGDSTYTRIVNIGFRAINHLRPAGREQLGLSVGILGTGFALSQKLLKEIPYTAASIVEDLEYHIAIINKGVRCHFIDNTGVFSAMPETDAGSETQRSRWEGGRIRMLFEHAPSLFMNAIKGKPRLLEPFCELMLLPLSMQLMLTLVLLFSPIDFIMWFGLVALAGFVFHVLAAIIATGGGLKEITVLLLVPKYILWKLGMTGQIINKTSKESNWDRTRRDL